MSGEKKWTRRAAVGLIGAGAGMLAVDTSGTLRVRSDREVSFGTKPDDEALVVLKNLDTGSVPVVKNEFGSKAMVTLSADNPVEFDVGNTGQFEARPVSFPLHADSHERWAVSSNTDPASIDVQFTIDGELVVDLTRAVSASQSGQFDLGIKTKAPGGSGRLSFRIENEGQKPATVTGIRVDNTDTEAEEVSRNNLANGVFLAGEGSNTALISNTILVVGANEVTEFDNDETIARDESREFTFRQFRRQPGNGNKNNVDMSDAVVDITLVFGDDSRRQFELDFPE